MSTYPIVRIAFAINASILSRADLYDFQKIYKVGLSQIIFPMTQCINMP